MHRVFIPPLVLLILCGLLLAASLAVLTSPSPSQPQTAGRFVLSLQGLALSH